MNNVEFMKFLGGLTFSTLLAYFIPGLLDLKLVGGSEEVRYRNISIAFVFISCILGYIYSRHLTRKSYNKFFRFNVVVFIVALVTSLLIKTFVDMVALPEFWDRSVWFTRPLLVISMFSAIGAILGSLANLK
jgi:uncharacterized membrane protein YfcA